jgi:zinc protease
MSSLNRKIQPSVIQVSPSDLTEADFFRLANGISVYSINAGVEDLVRLDFVFNAGQAFEKLPLISSSVNMMLNEGSENYTAEAMNKALDFFGAVPNLFAEKDTAGLSVAFLTKYTSQILELCLDMLFHPLFPVDELEALMKKRLQWFDVSRERVQAVASDKFFESVFGSTHPYGRISTRDDFSAINNALLSEFHASYYFPGNLTIIIAGKIPSEMNSLLNASFGMIPGKNSPSDKNISTPHAGKPERVFTEKKGAVQSALRIGSMTINKKHSDYHGLKIVDTILGGYFGSRLMKNIREEKGYTYGISSSVVSYNLAAYKVISTEVGFKHTSGAIDEVFKEIKRLQTSPVEREELDIVRNFMLGEMVRMFDGPFATADSFRAVWEFGLDYSYYTDLAEKIKTIGADEIIHLARTYYKTEDLFEIVVGPE